MEKNETSLMPQLAAPVERKLIDAFVVRAAVQPSSREQVDQRYDPCLSYCNQVQSRCMTSCVLGRR